MRTQLYLRISPVLLFTFLAGCSLIGQPVQKVVKPKGPPPPTAEEVYANTACQKNPARGMGMAKTLLADDPDNVATQLLHAYMVERTGRPVQAWELYTSLAGGDYGQTTSLTCGGTLVYSGAVSDVAKFRSIWLANDLKTQGVVLSPAMSQPQNLAPPRPTKAAQMVVLPPPFRENKPQETSLAMPKAASADLVKKEITKAPANTEGIFVHLASYKGPKALDRGWKEISRRHKKVLASYKKTSRSAKLKGKKGLILRLGVRTKNKADAQTLCKALKATRQYCAVLK